MMRRFVQQGCLKHVLMQQTQANIAFIRIDPDFVFDRFHTRWHILAYARDVNRDPSEMKAQDRGDPMRLDLVNKFGEGSLMDWPAIARFCPE